MSELPLWSELVSQTVVGRGSPDRIEGRTERRWKVYAPIRPAMRSTRVLTGPRTFLRSEISRCASV